MKYGNDERSKDDDDEENFKPTPNQLSSTGVWEGCGGKWWGQ
jgi:hypothetical protein